MKKPWVAACFALCMCWMWCLPSQAKDVRLALLIANQVGWKKDPKLRYVITGDLYPLAKALQKLGFQVYAILANRNAKEVRQAFRQLLKRVQKKPRVTTFFFYYSGHADKRYFHIGPRGKNPLSYKEFVDFLDKLRVKRRFGLIDACFSGEIVRHFGNLRQYRNLLNKNNQAKGVIRRLSRRDLSKHFPNQGTQVRGLQIVSSSRFLSFESRNRRASVLTYHFLRGLQGQADLDGDGKISFNELFLYTRPKVYKETGQNPQQWLFRMGSESYGFAPVYQSRLTIGSKVQGHLRVSVRGFVWKKHKKGSRRLRLSVASGPGLIELRKGGRCWQKKLLFRPRQESVLRGSGWRSVTCSSSLLQRKGGIGLPARVYGPWTPERWLTLEWQGGLSSSSGLWRAGGDLSGAGMFGLRMGPIGLLVGAWGSNVQFSDGDALQLALELRLEAGFHPRWSRFSLWLGGYAAGVALLKDLNRPQLKPGFGVHGGLSIAPAWWISERAALFLALDAGLAPGFAGGRWQLFFLGGLRLGLRFSLQSTPIVH